MELVEGVRRVQLGDGQWRIAHELVSTGGMRQDFIIYFGVWGHCIRSEGFCDDPWRESRRWDEGFSGTGCLGLGGRFDVTGGNYIEQINI
jgi:hypothetical protein